MSKALEQIVKGRPELIEPDSAFFAILLEGAVVSPFGAECCCLDDLPD